MNQSILLKAGLAVAGSVTLHLVLLGYIAGDREPPKVAGGRLQVQFGNYHGDLDRPGPSGEDEAAADEPAEPPAALRPEPQDAPPPEPPPEERPPEPEPIPEPEPVPEPEPQRIVHEALLPQPEPAATVPAPAPAPEPRPVQTETHALPSDAVPAPASTSSTPAEAHTAPVSSAGPRGQGSEDASAEIASDTPAQEAGNAASSNYSGLVMRHLSRMRLPRSSGSGSAYVSFTVGHEGELEAVEIARSSGSSRFDRDAIRVVQRAAPFPLPPAGVNRTFQVEIEGK